MPSDPHLPRFIKMHKYELDLDLESLALTAATLAAADGVLPNSVRLRPVIPAGTSAFRSVDRPTLAES